MKGQTPESDRQLAELRLEALVAQTYSRTRWTRIIMTLLPMLLGGYFFFAYSQIGSVNAAMAGEIVQHRVRQALPDARQALAAQLVKQAPSVMDRLEQAARRAPAQVHDYLLGAGVAEMKTKLGHLSDDLAPVLDRQLAAFAEEYKDIPADQRGQAILDRLALAFRDETILAVDRGYAHYHSKIEGAVARLEQLNRGENLDERQRLQRDLLATTAAMFDSWKPGHAKTARGPGALTAARNRHPLNLTATPTTALTKATLGAD